MCLHSLSRCSVLSILFRFQVFFTHLIGSLDECVKVAHGAVVWLALFGDKVGTTAANTGYRFISHLSSLWVGSRGNVFYHRITRKLSEVQAWLRLGTHTLPHLNSACTRSGSDYFPSFSAFGLYHSGLGKRLENVMLSHGSESIFLASGHSSFSSLILST